MYLELKKYLVESMSKNIVSAIVSGRAKGEIGMPCILDFDRISGYEGLNIVIDDMFKDGIPTINKLNYLTHEYAFSIVVTYPFPTLIGVPPGNKAEENSSSFHCIDTAPIVCDTFISSTIDSAKKIMPTKKKGTLISKLNELLEDNRYVNYVIKNINSSNLNTIIDDLCVLSSELGKTYKHNMCVYMYNNCKKALLDTASISFYKLKDVMPVFDNNRSRGVAMDILLTNSILTGNSITSGGCINMRMLFSEYKDNLLTIDGEKVMRQTAFNTRESITDQLLPLLQMSTPNDDALKKTNNTRKKGV